MSPHYGAPHRGTGVRLIPREYSLLLGGGKKKRRKKYVSFLLEKIIIWFREIRKINKWINKGIFWSECINSSIRRRDCNRAEGKVVPFLGRSRFLDQEWSTAGDKVVKSRFDARNFLPITDFDAASPRYSTTSKHRATVAPLTQKKDPICVLFPVDFPV